MTAAITTNTVSDSLLAAVNGKGAAAVSADSTAAAQDRFLTLLVTQMKNQDPLNPMDNAAVTSQLAQLSTVSGIDKLNTTLTALQGSYQSSQSLQATALIGKAVLAPGSSVTLAGGNAALGVDMTQAADAVKLSISDSSGKVVRTMDLGPQAIGTVPVSWNGQTDAGTTAADGTYKFSVAATNAGVAVTAATLSYGLVTSVSSSTAGVKLNIANVGAVDVGTVRQIM